MAVDRSGRTSIAVWAVARAAVPTAGLLNKSKKVGSGEEESATAGLIGQRTGQAQEKALDRKLAQARFERERVAKET
jgi:hypothetical protein